MVSYKAIQGDTNTEAEAVTGALLSIVGLVERLAVKCNQIALRAADLQPLMQRR